jgi:hypothetical protein
LASLMTRLALSRWHASSWSHSWPSQSWPSLTSSRKHLLQEARHASHAAAVAGRLDAGVVGSQEDALRLSAV